MKQKANEDEKEEAEPVDEKVVKGKKQKCDEDEEMINEESKV